MNGAAWCGPSTVFGSDQRTRDFFALEDFNHVADADIIDLRAHRQARAAAAAGEVESAVAHYQRVYGAVPDSETAAIADYDAAVLLMESGAWQRSVDAMQTFRSRYPGHRFQERVTINLASALMETGDRRQAANELVELNLSSNRLRGLYNGHHIEVRQ